MFALCLLGCKQAFGELVNCKYFVEQPTECVCARHALLPFKPVSRFVYKSELPMSGNHLLLQRPLNIVKMKLVLRSHECQTNLFDLKD